MKVGDIKIEAIKLMFTNYNFDMHIEDLPSMINDENYGSYLVNMNGSIARALDRIVNACVLPLKSYKIQSIEIERGSLYDRFDTSKIEDLFLIDRVISKSTKYYDGNMDYLMEGDVLLLNDRQADFTVLYYPKVKTVDDTISDEEELWIPDNIARLIPYFIKSELYQEEEPDIAANARNLFEACLDDLKMQKQSKQSYIVNVLGSI